ncbi:craniofacial development protein 2-like [Photinus pyralis]|uniref:craniofacial development protein 2-like n=1 Tax=Photinus pyralis TaxID=7054 RepID=UPI001267293B|nr:craniofacial development protein 2-like [Photinus pyralis]XP_031358791.1 craniofacial development protein 2-like [Photinus pyralis]
MTTSAMDNGNEMEKRIKGLRNKVRTWKLGVWNTRSMNGKENELVQEFEKAQLDILVISETKKKGRGTTKMDNNHLFIYSGVDLNERAAGGVGCLIHEKHVEKVYDWKSISERTIQVELIGLEGTKTTIIGVYGPNEDEKVERKDIFWDALERTTETAKGQVYIAGDFNCRVGRRDATYKAILGSHGEDARNSNGNRMLDFCLTNNLIITNSFYEHKDIHKYTREQHSRQEKSIIDYVLTETTNRKNIKDVKVSRKAEIGSDHYLLIATIKNENISARHSKQQKTETMYTETIKAYKLRNKDVAKEFTQTLDQKLESWEQEENLEKLWTSFKVVVLDTARKTCGISKMHDGKKKTAWWSEKIKLEVKKKWQQYIKSRTPDKYEEYKHQRGAVKNLVLQAKKKSWEDFGRKLEENSKGNQKLFFKVIKTLRKNRDDYIFNKYKRRSDNRLKGDNEQMERVFYGSTKRRTNLRKRSIKIRRKK